MPHIRFNPMPRRADDSTGAGVVALRGPTESNTLLEPEYAPNPPDMATRKTARKTAREKTAPSKTTKTTKTTKTPSAPKAAKKTVAKKPAPAKATAKAVVAKKSSAASGPDARAREICLALPEAHEVEAWGLPTYRVKNKVFVMLIPAENHHHGGRPAAWICASHAEQDLVVRARPTSYFKPPYVGPSGWIGAYLDGKPPWMEIAELIREGYRRRAPKKLAALLGE